MNHILSSAKRMNSFVSFMTAAIALLVGCIDTANAQNNITFSPPAGLTFTVQVGGTTGQILNVSTSGAPLSITAVPSTTTGGQWLSISPPNSTTPATFVVNVNATGLSPNTYTGSIMLSATGATNTPVTVPVTLIVTANSPLAASPNSLAFTFTTGSPNPASQTINVSSATPLAFTTSVATSSGGTWLSANPPTATTPSAVNVNVTPSTLGPGNYNGTVTLTPAGGGGPQVVSVSLTVSSAPTISVNPTNLTLYYQTSGSANPGPQSVSVTTNGNPVNFTVTPSTSSGGNWLVVSPAAGVSTTTPATLVVGVNTAAVPPPGTYNGTINISAPGVANPPPPISVTLVVSANPLILPSASSLSYGFQIGAAAPVNQSISLATTSPGTPSNFTATAFSAGGNWLVVNPSNGTTPGTIVTSVDPAIANTLSPGVYAGQVVVTGPALGNSPLTIPILLTISNNPLLTVLPPSIQFNYQIGKTAPAAQTISLNSTGAPLNFTANGFVTTGGAWLTVTPSSGTTPATLSIQANPTGLTQNTYTGSVIVSASGPGNTPQTIPVTFVVSNSPLVNASPGALSFTTSVTNPQLPPVQNIALTSTGDPVTFTITSSTTGAQGWLFVTPAGGTTPANLSVFVNPTGLAVNNYSGSIVVTSGGVSQTIPVSLTVNSGDALTATPNTLSFTQSMSGPAPASQMIAVTSSAGSLAFSTTATTTTGGSWLTVSPATGTTPGSVTVSVNGATLAPGPYAGVITLVSNGASNSPQYIPVSLTVGPAQSLTASNASLGFISQIAGPAPATQTVNITTTGGAAVPFTATASGTTAGGVNWLTVTPASGTTPGTLTIRANPTGLAAGPYTGSITVTPTGGGAPVVIAVTYTVAAQTPPVIESVLNGASLQPGPVISPGEIITVKGTAIGPAAAASFQLNGSGGVDATLSNTRLLFDGIGATILYTSATQINAIVPYGLTGRLSTQVQVEFMGVRSNPITLAVGPAAPGVFTVNSTGSGPGAVVNLENSALNTPVNPATRGQFISIYATGEGQTNPPGVDGSVGGAALKRPLLPVSVTIGGVPVPDADVAYAGSSTGFVSGLLQINARVPAGVTPGSAVPVVITINGVSSRSDVTIAVQ